MIADGNPVTIKDVARRAGCSPAVVSTVVNGAKGNTMVGARTRQRVLRAARELGYRTNFASRSLVRRRTSTLGIYIPPSPWSGLGFSYDDTILRGVETACRASDHDLLLINMTGTLGPQVCLDKFAERRIDGLVLIHAEPGSPWIGDLVAAGRNVVAVDYSNPEPGLDAVVFDNAAAGRLAVEHLVSLGHRRIGFIGSCRQPPSLDGLLRQQGFLEAMAAHGLPVRPAWVFDHHLLERPLRPQDEVCQAEGLAGARHIVSLGPRGPTAWIAYADLVAVNVLSGLRTAGKRVPLELSVMGVDDSEWCRVATPPLASLRHPLEEMGRAAVELLVARSAAGGSRTSGRLPRVGRHVIFQPELVARESTARWMAAEERKVKP